MARIMGHPPTNKWEKEVRDQLRQQLPQEWIVISGVAWSRRGPGDGWTYVRDGQADLVVLAPGHGMVVIEVKGSRGFRIDEDGCWYRHDPMSGAFVKMKEPPPLQANDNMHELADVVAKRGRWGKFPGRYAYVVIYPQGKLLDSPPATHDESTLVSQAQMHQLKARMELALSLRGHGSTGANFDTGVAQEVAALLVGHPFRIEKADTDVDLREDARGIEVLTRQQYAALQGIFRLPRVAVAGPAGSGKTVLALWRLQALVAEGKRAIYLCFNKDLAQALRRRHPELVENIDNADRLFWRITHNSGKLPPKSHVDGNLSTFLRDELPWLASEVLMGWPDELKYDAVLVDEGQDFSEAQLLAALSLVREDTGTYTFFADWRQDVFRQASTGVLGVEVFFTLHHNCRNTQRINARTNLLLAAGVDSMPGMPDGVDPIVEHCSSPTSMASRAWKIAKDWSRAGESVVILSPYVLQNSCMQSAPRGHGLTLVTSIDELGAPDTVYFSTVKSFKGIEAAYVIVVDVDAPKEDSAFRPEDLYVACTRPTARLAFLSRSAAAAEWLAGQVAKAPSSEHSPS